jgi:hypothetical protein
MCRQYCPGSDQRVELQEPIDRPASQLPELFSHRGDNTEPDKQQEEEDLAYSSCLYNFHDFTFS